MRLHFFIGILLFFISFLVPQTGVSQNLSTEGDDFWIGFMDNWLQDPDNPIILEIYISADDSTNAHIEIPYYSHAFPPLDLQVTPDNPLRVPIPTALAMNEGTNQVQNRGVHVTTDKDVSVYAMNKRQYSADVATVLPTYTLGNHYIVVSHWEDGNRNNNDNSDSEFVIVAVEDNTRIQITPSHLTEGGNTQGIPFSITLNDGQTYQVQARGDLTGTKVEAVPNTDSECKRFAVFAGNQYTKVGECDDPNGHDHLYAQMYPVPAWGKEYITVDFNKRQNGDHVKVIAAEDNSGIYLNGGLVDVLQEGEFLLLKELTGVNYISSDKVITVAQFSRSQACDNSYGDPFMILINPNPQVLQKITFFTPTIATLENYNLTIVARTDDLPTVMLDGKHISGYFLFVPYNHDYSYAKLSISSGNHKLQSEKGIIAYVYGYGHNESFGYPTGAGLSNLNLGIEIRDETGESIPFDSICHDTGVWFYPETDYDYTNFQWNFGDGTVVVKVDPDSVYHVFEKPGKYIVELRASTGSSGCLSGADQSSVRAIRVLKPAVTITGPRSVCPNTPAVPYTIKDGSLYSYHWSLKGGDFASDTLTEDIRVNWGQTDPSAWIGVVAEDHRGCKGDTIHKPVKIKVQLEPDAPFGPDSLCSTNISNISYNTFSLYGSTYQWHTDYGEIISGQGSDSVLIDWDSWGLGHLWFNQTTITDTVCAGISDTLLVYIQRQPLKDAFILTDRDEYSIAEPIEFKIESDSLFQMVNWQFDNGQKQDSALLNLNPIVKYNCPGTYLVTAAMIDTVGLCEVSVSASKEIHIKGPEPYIIQVSHEYDIPNELFIKWDPGKDDYFDKPYFLVKDGNYLDTLTDNVLVYPDSAVMTGFNRYEYSIQTNLDCGEATGTAIHRNILLLDTIYREDPDRIMLEWEGGYQGWENGVEKYELWLSVDGQPFKSYQDQGRNTTQAVFDNQDLGFEHCFKVLAKESGGHHGYSWSNIACATLIPPLYPYNIITPNGDGKNEVFVIENIEHYPNSVLTIFNRWGKKVFKVTGYRNNWSGMHGNEVLSNSVYYFVLELNEPRNPLKTINGTVTILK